jgi:NAD+ kinase
MKPIRSLAFVVNADKPGAEALGRELALIARKAGVKSKQTRRFPLAEGYLRGCDACCVIGGDGTLLGVVEEAARHQVPVIGVNRGSLGFLTTLSAEEARVQFPDFLRGAFRVDERAMLECTTSPGRSVLALNDVLIKDEVNSRLVNLEVIADDELVTDYLCDGLIFSTATGSTAYNLSAGGPIIHPGADVIAMTPICPHTLTNRSIIFRDSVKVSVFNRSDHTQLLVGMDGHRAIRVGSGASVDISLSKVRLPLAQRRDYSHFAIVRTKLKWSGGVADRE